MENTADRYQSEAEHPESRRDVKLVGRNAVFLGVSFLSHALAQLLILSIIARLAGVENAGIWAYIVAFTDPFGVFMDFGTTRMLVPEIARNRVRADQLLGNALTLGLLVAVPALILLALLAYFLPHHTPIMIRALPLAGIAVLFSTLSLSIRSAFRAFNRFDLEAVVTIVFSVLMLGGSLAVLSLGVEFTSIFIVSALASLVVLIQSWALYNRHLGSLRLRYDREIIWRTVAAKSLVFMMINLLYRAFMRVDLLIVGYFRGPVAVGYYGLVSMLFYRMDILARLFIISVLPSLAQVYSTQRARFSQYVNWVLKFQLVVVLPLAVLGSILAAPLIKLLFGADYEPSILFFQLLVLVVPLRFITRTFTITLAAMDLQVRTAIALAVAAAFNILANLILVPLYGALGATVISIVSEFLLFILVYFALTSDVRKGIRWRGLARLFPSFIVLVPAVYLVRDWPLWIAMPIGLAAYALMLFGTRAFSQSEAELLAGLLEVIRPLPLNTRHRLARIVVSRAHSEGQTIPQAQRLEQ